MWKAGELTWLDQGFATALLQPETSGQALEMLGDQVVVQVQEVEAVKTEMRVVVKCLVQPASSNPQMDLQNMRSQSWCVSGALASFTR